MPQSTIELWYVELAYNNNNSPVYVDMVEDMAKLGNGVFNATFKLDAGNICDYAVIESDKYVEPCPSKAY